MKIVQIAVSAEIHKRLKEEAWRRRTTMADTLRAVLNEHLPRLGTPDTAQPASEVTVNG